MRQTPRHLQGTPKTIFVCTWARVRRPTVHPTLDLLEASSNLLQDAPKLTSKNCSAKFGAQAYANAWRKQVAHTTVLYMRVWLQGSLFCGACAVGALSAETIQITSCTLTIKQSTPSIMQLLPRSPWSTGLASSATATATKA